MRMRRLLTILSVLCLAGCGRVADRPVVDKVVLAKDDAKMQEAIAKARSTAPDFIEALKTKKRGADDFSVKVLFKDGGQAEHMWISRLTFVGGKFVGFIGNEPKFVHNVRLGQLYEAAPAEITDWMYVADGKLVGGYTLRVITFD